MSGSKGLKRYNGVEQDDEGAYVYYDEHIAALRRAKAEVWREAEKEARLEISRGMFTGDYQLACRYLAESYSARAAQIEEGVNSHESIRDGSDD